MFNAQVIGNGNTALLESFAMKLRQLVQSIDLTQANAYVVAFGGDSLELGRFEPANVGMIAGGTLPALKALHNEMGRVIAEAEEAQRYEAAMMSPSERVREAREALLRRIYGGSTPPVPDHMVYDDYYRDIEDDGRQQQADEPQSFADFVRGLGLRVVPNPMDGGPAIRCADYPNCGCSPSSR